MDLRFKTVRNLILILALQAKIFLKNLKINSNYKYIDILYFIIAPYKSGVKLKKL